MDGKMRNIIIFLGLIFVLVGCPNTSNSDLNHPDVVVMDNVGLCSPACIKARSLNCAEGNNLVYPIVCVVDDDCYEKAGKHGLKFGSCRSGKCMESCEEVCSALVENGRMLNLDCWTSINKCSEIEDVCRKVK
jgi:hypothetical protein